MILSNPPCRVLIADENLLARALLRKILEAAGIEVIAEAVNGQDAIVKTRQLRPHLVTINLYMPVISGLKAIEAIMHEKAVPILVVGSRYDAKTACIALEAGALDVIATPDDSPEQALDFISKVYLLAGVPVITRLRRYSCPLATGSSKTNQPHHQAHHHSSSPQRVVALAASTGGPQALAQLLPSLGANFPAPILLAQHISDGFVEGMAHWLNQLCTLSVKVAEDGEQLNPGWIYISPSEQHLTVTSNHRLALVNRQQEDIYRPSCDQLFSSVAEVYKEAAIGVIMTGMGRDGAQGLLRIRQAGGQTLAQNEASSVIYGMNQEAVLLGAVEQELSLAQIADYLVQLVLPSSIGSNWLKK